MASPLTTFLLLLLILCGCGSKAPEKLDEYELTGEIVRLDSVQRIATIRHDDIKSREGKVWMKAMTMEFPVKDATEFSRLEKAMRINATLFSRDSDLAYWIGRIQPERPAPSTGKATSPPLADSKR